jgi:hypothetical protein
MKLTLKSLLFSSAALCATAAFAANQARVDVPFGFSAKGQWYPAGVYALSSEGNSSFVTMASKVDLTKQLTWTVGPSEPAKSAAVVKFDVVGDSHLLKSIQLGDKITPNLDKGVKRGVSATVSVGGQ